MRKKAAPQEHSSDFVQHLPCDKCGSSDGNSLYSDGHQKCFVCGNHIPAEGEAPKKTEMSVEAPFTAAKFTPCSIPARHITEKTTSLFQYGEGQYYNKKTKTNVRAAIANIFDTTGRYLVAQKVRMKGKEFAINGSIKKAGLFGQQLWRDGGKRVIVTEGLEDAMVLCQVLGHTWPVVSLVGGATGAYKELQRNLEWLQRFDQVVLMFDMDDVGQEAATQCAPLFKPRQCAIAYLPEKDACDMVAANRVKELTDAVWNAKTYRPEGIVCAADCWEDVKEFTSLSSIPYPWKGLNEILQGLRDGEIVTVAAGSGIGKSHIVREVAYASRDKVSGIGYVALEENKVRTIRGFMGLYLEAPIHQGYGNFTLDQIRDAFEKTVGSGKVYCTDHWGSLDKDELIDKIRYLIKGCECNLIVLDHISIAVSGNESIDERKDIDILMTNLRTLVEETGCKLILVTHLKRPDGKKGHEDGLQVSLSHLRGSGSIAQLSDIVIAGERNQQHPTARDLTLLRILKNRFSGETGPACYLRYVKEKGRCYEVSNAEAEKLLATKKKTPYEETFEEDNDNPF